jgi:CRISPR-associated protein Cmr3
MSVQIFLTPVDVWLFRDGKPFSAGSDHRAESRFPPYPTVLQGAIRAYELALKKIDLHDKGAIEHAVGKSYEFGNLRLKGPYLTKWDKAKGDEPIILNRYFPQPVDAISVSQEGHTLRKVDPPKSPPGNIKTSCPTPALLGLAEPLLKGENGLWLSQIALIKYLEGETVTAIPAAELFLRESRFGIGIDAPTATTREGLLYETEYVRPGQGVGLLADFNGFEGWPANGVLQLGGEARAAIFDLSVPALPYPELPKTFPKHFKVYFATPTYFRNGWLPEAWSDFFTGDVRLVSAAVGRYESQGGIDLMADPHSATMHRPSRRFVPAGSVYYFESANAVTLKEGLIQNAITEFGAEIGFGQIVIKEW